jgi:hypothetical protein
MLDYIQRFTLPSLKYTGLIIGKVLKLKGDRKWEEMGCKKDR